MDPNLQRRVQRYGWDKATEFYESFWEDQLSPAHEKLQAMLEVNEGDHALDIACGSGQVTFPVANKVGVGGHVIGTDLSDKMIELASKNAISKKIPNATFQQMDAENLIFNDQHFDIVYTSLGLMYFPEPIKALNEFKRVLKDNGQLGIAVWGNRKRCGWAEVFEIVDKRVASEVCPMFFQFGNKLLMEKTLKGIGFGNVQLEIIQTKLKYNTDEEAYGAAFAGGPVALAYNKFNNDVKHEVHEEYLHSIREYRSSNGYEIPGEFLICTCIK